MTVEGFLNPGPRGQSAEYKWEALTPSPAVTAVTFSLVFGQ